MINTLIVITPLLLKWNFVFALVAAASFIFKPQLSWLSSRARQQIVRTFILMTFLAPIVSLLATRFIEPANIFAPPVQIAAPRSSSDFNSRKFGSAVISFNTATAEEAQTQTVAALSGSILLLILVTTSIASRGVILFRDRRRLQALIRSSFTVRHIGHVKIQLSQKTVIPFAARSGGFAYVVLPPTLLERPDEMKIAIQHELQHHRQNDLRWNWLLEAVRLVCGWNPLVPKWLKRIEELDELACDENLLGRGRIDVKRYANCLFQAALAIQTTGDQARLAGTAGMATSPHFLKRRIEMTLLAKKRTQTWITTLMVGTVVIVTTATAWTTESLIKDRRISESQATTLANSTRAKSKIPIVINRRVLNFLNVAVGTPRSRFYMRNALKRMKAYKAMVEAKLEKAKLPLELAALPVVESGYQNTETTTSAGLWQFIPATAKKYGLEVDDVKDDRLDPSLETDAAVAYFRDLNTVFPNEWWLSLLSYNAGERNVQELVAKTGERDVFKLADDGRIASQENANYVARLLAVLLVIDHPELVNE